eukprot:1144677-Pelagomonas_calceolata.AAC.3
MQAVTSAVTATEAVTTTAKTTPAAALAAGGRAAAEAPGSAAARPMHTPCRPLLHWKSMHKGWHARGCSLPTTLCAAGIRYTARPAAAKKSKNRLWQHGPHTQRFPPSNAQRVARMRHARSRRGPVEKPCPWPC